MEHIDYISNKKVSFKASKDGITCTMLSIKQVDQRYAPFDIESKLMGLSKYSSPEGVSTSKLQMTSNTNIKDDEEKISEIESSVKGETLPIPVEPGNNNGIQKSLQASFLFEGLEPEMIIDSDACNVGKIQAESIDYVESVIADHILESHLEPGLKDCSNASLNAPRGEHAHAAHAQDFKKDEDSDTTIETVSLLEMPKGLKLNGTSTTSELRPSPVKGLDSHHFDDTSNVSKLRPLSENPTVSRSRGSLKRVLKYSQSASSLESTSLEGKSNKSVGFANISIRNYDMTLGDHPNCSYGPPICLSWDYEDSALTSLDNYEENRPERRKLRPMGYNQRKNILTFAGFKEAELKITEKKIDEVRRQRNMSKALLPIMEVEILVESVRRKCKRAVKKSDTI